MASDIIPIELGLPQGDLVTLWAPRWREDGEEWEAFLGDDEDLYAFPDAAHLAAFVRTAEQHDLIDHPSWHIVPALNGPCCGNGRVDATRHRGQYLHSSPSSRNRRRRAAPKMAPQVLHGPRWARQASLRERGRCLGALNSFGERSSEHPHVRRGRGVAQRESECRARLGLAATHGKQDMARL